MGRPCRRSRVSTMARTRAGRERLSEVGRLVLGILPGVLAEGLGRLAGAEDRALVVERAHVTTSVMTGRRLASASGETVASTVIAAASGNARRRVMGASPVAGGGLLLPATRLLQMCQQGPQDQIMMVSVGSGSRGVANLAIPASSSTRDHRVPGRHHQELGSTRRSLPLRLRLLRTMTVTTTVTKSQPLCVWPWSWMTLTTRTGRVARRKARPSPVSLFVSAIPVSRLIRCPAPKIRDADGGNR